jgi:hypothetical protein
MNRTNVQIRTAGLLILAIQLPALPAMGDVFSDIGFTDLVARLGAGNVPTGAGIGCGQVEAQETTGNFGPNTSNAQFAGKTFTPMSGAFGASSHATTVGQNFYGLTGRTRRGRSRRRRPRPRCGSSTTAGSATSPRPRTTTRSAASISRSSATTSSW